MEGPMVFLIIVVIGTIVLAICNITKGVKEYNNAEKEIKNNSFDELNKLQQNHNIDVIFRGVNEKGFIAFSDAEEKCFGYSDAEEDGEWRLAEIYYKDIKNAWISDDRVKLWAPTKKWPSGAIVFICCQTPADREETYKKLKKISETNMSNVEMAYLEQHRVPATKVYATVREHRGICGDTNIDGKAYIWVADRALYILKAFDKLMMMDGISNKAPLRIPKENIVELSQSGDVHYSTKVSGGGGGGSSIAGAVVGGIIAGDAGAIIGSRKGVNEVTSSTEIIDDRETHLKMLDDSNNFCEIIFDYNDYYVLKKLIDSME